MNTSEIQSNIMATSISPLGNWAYLVDENNFIFVTLSSAQYPLRGLDLFLSDFKKKFYEIVPDAAITPINGNEVDPSFMANIVKMHTTHAGHDSGREAYIIKMHECQEGIRENIAKSEAKKESTIVIT